MASQSLFLAESLYASTGVWSDNQGDNEAKKAKIAEKPCPDPDSIKSRFKRLFCFDQAECEGIPLVCRGRLEEEKMDR